MVARFDFLPKLLWGIGRDVDLPSQPRLRLAKRWRQVSKTCSANDHHIHVTHRMFPASCHRTIDKSALNLVPKRFSSSERYHHLSGWPSVAASTPCRTCGNNAVSTEELRILRILLRILRKRVNCQKNRVACG